MIHSSTVFSSVLCLTLLLSLSFFLPSLTVMADTQQKPNSVPEGKVVVCDHPAEDTVAFISSQPSMATTQRPQNGVPHDWSTGLCECNKDWENAMDVLLCHRCVLSQQYNLLYNGEPSIHWPLLIGTALLDALSYTVPSAFLCTAVLIRQSLRRRYQIGEANPDVTNASGCAACQHDTTSMGEDFFAVCCCTVCATCQQHREMTLRGDWPGKCLFGTNPADRFASPQASSMV